MTGYRQPPVDTRFRKGHSGNPGGRPRRDKDLFALIERALDRPAPPETAEGGRRLSRREAVVARLVEQAAAGELRATKLLLDLAQRARRAAVPDPIDQGGEDRASICCANSPASPPPQPRSPMRNELRFSLGRSRA